MNKDKVVAVVTTYARAAVPTVLAMYMSGVSDPKVLAYADRRASCRERVSSPV